MLLFPPRSPLSLLLRSRWLILLPAVALAVAALTLLAIVADPAAAPVLAQAPAECSKLVLDQDEEYTPGATVDLDFTLSAADGGDCVPGNPNDEITIELPEELTIPTSFDERDDISIRAGPRYTHRWAEIDEGDDEPHRMVLPGCQGWEDSSNDPADCNQVILNNVRIVLNNLRLPDQPPEDDDDTYEVSIQWGDGSKLTDTLRVDATLKVDGDNEVGYGETITITGIGFSNGYTARLFAFQSTSTVQCQNTSGAGWREIATAEVGSNHRFAADVEVSTVGFPSADGYQICASDGAGRSSHSPLRITVNAGLEVTGSAEVSPGERVTLRLVGGRGPGIIRVTVAGQDVSPSNWQQSGDTLSVTMPPGLTGTVSVRAHFQDGSSASAKVTIADATLDVSRIPSGGVAMGETIHVSARDLVGQRVCEASLGGARIAILEDNRDLADCVDIRRGGLFNATLLLADTDGSISTNLISRIINLDEGDRLKLEITDDAGVKASTDVLIAIPRITFTPDDGVIQRGQPILIRGENFPPDRLYYRAPPVELSVNGRRVASEYPTAAGTWQHEYRQTDRLEPGQAIRIEVTLGDYRLSALTADLRLEVASAEVHVSPPTVQIGTPITITITGLDRYTGGYRLRIRNGPTLIPSFTTDREGQSTTQTTFPEFEPSSFALGEAVIFLELYQGRERVPGVHASLTLRQGFHPTPTPVPTATPLPTLTPTPTMTPAPPTPTPVPTHTPTPVPTATPIPTPTPTSTPTLTPVPTETPLPPATIDRAALSATVVASLATPMPDGSVDQPGGIGGISPTMLIVLLAAVAVLIVAAAIAAAVMLILRRRQSRRPLDDGDDGVTITTNQGGEP